MEKPNRIRAYLSPRIVLGPSYPRAEVKGQIEKNMIKTVFAENVLGKEE